MFREMKLHRERAARVQPDPHDGRLRRAAASSRSASWPGMRGLMAKPSGEIIETPDHGQLPRRPDRAAVLHLDARRPQGPGRHGAQDRRLRLPDAPAGRRGAGRDHHRARLRHAATASRSGRSSKAGEIIEPLRDRIVGRVALEDVSDPFDGEVIVDAQRRRSTEELASRRSRTPASSRCKIRSVLTCESRRGVCIRCYGRNLATGTAGRARRGGRRHRRPVDRRAGHAAHDAHVPHRRHGVAHRASRSTLEAKSAGAVQVTTNIKHGREPATATCVVMNRTGAHRASRTDEGPRARALHRRLRRRAEGQGRRARSSTGQIAGRVGSVHVRDPHRSAAAQVRFKDIDRRRDDAASRWTRSPVCRALVIIESPGREEAAAASMHRGRQGRSTQRKYLACRSAPT